MRFFILCFFILLELIFPALASAITPMVSGGYSHTVALRADGTVMAWGNNSHGQLGDGTTISSSSPLVVPGLAKVMAVAAGGQYTIALKADGTLVAWGYNDYGQLGDGTTTTRLSPVAVPGLSNMAAVAAGGNYTVALKSDGAVMMWGNNDYGQLGDGTTASSSSPLVVPGLTGVVAVAAGSQHTVALKADGTLVAWGNNDYGQLGDGTTISHTSSLAVPALSNVTAVAAGGNYTVALKSDGTLVAWGDNGYGQLGDGTTTTRLSPLAIPGLSEVVAVAATRYLHTVALKSDGTMMAWGNNDSGQLGDGTMKDRHSPVAVLEFGETVSNNQAIAADQAGNATYNAATAVTQNITIGVGSQTIAANQVGNASYNAVAQTKASEYDFNVVSATKDQTHPHFNIGSPTGFVVNGVQGRTLVLVRGKTYTFNVDTGVMHDFYFTTSPIGWGAGTLTDGVDGQFIYKGIVTFKPSAGTPDIIYYQCRNHKFMGGQIYIANPGEEGKIKLPEPTAAATSAQAVTPTLSKGELGQRINFLEMTINNSDLARRIAASNNAEAKAKLKDAQEMLAAARSALDSGNLELCITKLQLCTTKIDEAEYKLLTEAGRLVPSEFMQKKAKNNFDELVQSVKALEASYARIYEDFVKEVGGESIEKLDNDKIHKMIGSAKTLFEEGNHDKANKILFDAKSEISRVLANMFANTAISKKMKFSSEIKFSSQEQEFTFELAHFSSHEEELPQAIAQMHPSSAEIALMELQIKSAKEKRDQAVADAKQRNFAGALEKIKNASGQLEEALKSIGVR